MPAIVEKTEKKVVNLREKVTVYGIANKDNKLVPGQEYEVSKATAQNLVDSKYASFEKPSAAKPAAKGKKEDDKPE